MRGAGVIEYRSYEDMKDALRQLHDTELRGSYVKLYEVSSQPAWPGPSHC